MKERDVGGHVEKPRGIVHGVENKECVADRDGLRTDAMEKLGDLPDMYAPKDQTLV